MRPIRVVTIFGVRPEAIKMAPVIACLRENPGHFEVRVVVTAQHREMLDQVLDHFSISPDYDLDIMRPQQTLTEVTVRALRGLRPVLVRENPDLVLVHGDTATTFAGSLAAFYRQVPVGHVEAGLRTRCKYAPFPEEMNRRLTGVLADLHFAPTATARSNLLAEGVQDRSIFVTGNTAIDALHLTVKKGYRFQTPLLRGLDFGGRKVVVVDAHRRENFGRPMEEVCLALRDIASGHPEVELVFSVHKNPAVEEVARRLLSGCDRVHLVEPLPYPEWANLMKAAYLIITDSGGLQEEAPSLGTPVLLLRDTTERPEALEAGTVVMVGPHRERIVSAVGRLLRDPLAYEKMSRAVNPYGDGRAAERIRAAILYHFGRHPQRPPEYKGAS